MMYLGGIHYWWPKIFASSITTDGRVSASSFRRLQPDVLPQFIVGYLACAPLPRYPPSSAVNILSRRAVIWHRLRAPTFYCSTRCAGKPASIRGREGARVGDVVAADTQLRNDSVVTERVQLREVRIC